MSRRRLSGGRENTRENMQYNAMREDIPRHGIDYVCRILKLSLQGLYKKAKELRGKGYPLPSLPGEDEPLTDRRKRPITTSADFLQV